MELPHYALSIFIFGFSLGWLALWIIEQIVERRRKRKNIISTDVDKKNNNLIQVTLQLDGKVLCDFIYDQTRAGKKTIHSRGISYD